MAEAPKRWCSTPGCQNYQPCPVHKKPGRVNDAWRGSSTSRGYGARWQRFRGRYLQRHPLCADCLPVPVAATEVHHLKKVAEFPELMYVEENCLGLCKKCHSRRTQRGE